MSHNLVLAGLMVSLLVVIAPTHVAAEAGKLQISSPVLSEGATIPMPFTCSGANQSPPLTFSAIPQRTRSLVLLVEDPDAPSGTFVHWVVYDIPPGSHGFKEGNVEGTQGVNGMGKAIYMGPCPPPGTPHHYHFRLFALDTNLSLEGGPNAQAVRDAMNGHVIESTELVGIFGR